MTLSVTDVVKLGGYSWRSCAAQPHGAGRAARKLPRSTIQGPQRRRSGFNPDEHWSGSTTGYDKLAQTFPRLRPPTLHHFLLNTAFRHARVPVLTSGMYVSAFREAIAAGEHVPYCCRVPAATSRYVSEHSILDKSVFAVRNQVASVACSTTHSIEEPTSLARTA